MVLLTGAVSSDLKGHHNNRFTAINCRRRVGQSFNRRAHQSQQSGRRGNFTDRAEDELQETHALCGETAEVHP